MWKIECWKLNVENWMLKVRCWMWKIECGKLNVENWMLRIECWKLNVENCILKIECWKLNVENWMLKIECWKLNVENLVCTQTCLQWPPLEPCTYQVGGCSLEVFQSKLLLNSVWPGLRLAVVGRWSLFRGGR
jgi:hypothetical protein